AHAEHFVDLATLLFTDYDNAIGGEAGEKSFDGEKQTRLELAVVTVKDVSVIGVHKTTALSFSTQSGVHQSGHASDRAGFGCVGVHDVGLLPSHEAEKFPDRQRILHRDFAAHFRQRERLHA